MKQIGCWLVVCALFVSSSAHCVENTSSEALQRQLFIALLLDQDVQKATAGARSIEMIYPQDEALCDLLAEKLVQSTKAEPTRQYVDAVEWFVELLGDLRNPRYRDVLLQVRERLTNKEIIKKIDTAVLSIGIAHASQYAAGVADLAVIQTDAQQALTKARHEKHDGFTQIAAATTLPEVLARLGAPDDATAWTSRAQKLLLHYAGYGLFVLTVDRDTSPQWIVAATYPELLPVSSLYKGDNFGMAQTLGSFNGRFLMAFIKSDGRKIVRDTGALSVLAKRVEVLPFPEDRYDQAVLEKGLRALAGSKDPEALLILQATAAASSGKGKKLADEYVQLAHKHKEAIARKAALNKAQKHSEQDEDEAAMDEVEAPADKAR